MKRILFLLIISAFMLTSCSLFITHKIIKSPEDFEVVEKLEIPDKPGTSKTEETESEETVTEELEKPVTTEPEEPATPEPEEPVTTKPEPEKPNGPSVVDALNISKPLVVPPFEDLDDNTLIIPALNSTSPAAKEINAEIYNDLIIFDDDEKLNGYVFHVHYEYTDVDGIIGIMTYARYGRYATGGNYPDIKFYYYDMNTDTKLTFDEYLSKLGLTYETATERLNADDKFMNRDWPGFEKLGTKNDVNHLVNGIFGKDKTFFSAINSSEMMGEYEEKFDAGPILY